MAAFDYSQGPSEWRFLTIAPCDAAEPWQLGSGEEQGIIDYRHDIFFFLILILVFVSRILVRALWHFHEQTNPRGTTIEIIRTILPSIILMFIAIPSFALLYSMDEVVFPDEWEFYWTSEVQQEGVYYDQYSAIRGTNQAFAPIVVENVPFKDYGIWLSNQFFPPFITKAHCMQGGGALPDLNAPPPASPENVPGHPVHGDPLLAQEDFVSQLLLNFWEEEEDGRKDRLFPGCIVEQSLYERRAAIDADARAFISSRKPSQEGIANLQHQRRASPFYKEFLKYVARRHKGTTRGS